MKEDCKHVWKDFGDQGYVELMCEKCYAHYVPSPNIVKRWFERLFLFRSPKE